MIRRHLVETVGKTCFITWEIEVNGRWIVRALPLRARYMEMSAGFFWWQDKHRTVDEAFPFLSFTEKQFLLSGLSPSEQLEVFHNRDGDDDDTDVLIREQMVIH